MGPLAYHHHQELIDINLDYPMETETMIKLPIGYKKKKDYYYYQVDNYQKKKERQENNEDDDEDDDQNQEYNYFQKLVSPLIKLEELIQQFQDLPSFIFHQDFDYFITCWMEYQYYIILSKEPIWRPKVMHWLDNAIKYLESIVDYYYHHQSSVTAVTTNGGGEELKFKECPQSSTFHMYWAFKRLLNYIKIMAKLITMIENGRWLNQTPQMVVVPIYNDILQQRFFQPFSSSSPSPSSSQLSSLAKPQPLSSSPLSPPPPLSYYSSTLSSSFSTPLQTPFNSDNYQINPINNMNPFENQFHHVVESSSTTSTPPSSASSSSASSSVPSPIIPFHSISSSSSSTYLPSNNLLNLPTVLSSPSLFKSSYSYLEVIPYLNDSYSNNISYVHPTSVMLPSTSLSSIYPNKNNNSMDCYNDQSAITTNNCFYYPSTQQIQKNHYQQQQYYQHYHSLLIDMNNNNNNYHQHHHPTSFPSFYPKEFIHEVVEEEVIENQQHHDQEVGFINKPFHHHQSLPPTPLIVSSYPYHHHQVLKNIENQVNDHDNYEEIVEDIEIDDNPMKDKDYQDNKPIMTNEDDDLDEDDLSDDDDDPLLSNYSKKKRPTKKGYAKNKNNKNNKKKKIDNNNANTTIVTTTTATTINTTNKNNNIQLKKISINSQQQRRQRRRGRTATSYDTETTKYLKRVFFTVYSQRDKLTKEQRKEVQRHTQLQPRNITYWFSNHKRRFQESLELYKRVIAESNGFIKNYDDYLNWRREKGLPEED